MSKMKYAAAFTVFCVFVSRTLGSNVFEACTKQNTYDYRYVKMYPVDILKSESDKNPMAFRLEFYVKAASNAHILLSEDENENYSPGYEIVIGAGHNLFSQIRVYGNGNKASQMTPNIMSPIEFRGFWIELKSRRLIWVGNKGETEPFLFWIIPNESFSVRYFGFSTWKSVKGEWYFNCEDKSNQDPENMEGEANMTDTQRLKMDLLTFYDPMVIPQKEGYPDETIELYLEATYFFLDEKTGELTLSGMADVKWTDWKLVWEPETYGGLKHMYVSPFHIWTPGVRVLNSFTIEKKNMLALSGNVRVNSNGESFWRVPFHSVTLCLMEYKNWPFDMHNCTLLFGFLVEPLKIRVKNMSVQRISKYEWEIQEVNGRDGIIWHDDNVGGVVDISFRRREPSFEFVLLPPFLGAAVLALASFWIQPNSSVKLFLNCGSMIILILLLFSICERIVTTVTATPTIVLLYSWSVLVMCVPIVLYVGLKYVPPYIHLPRWLSSILNSSIIKLLFFLPENSDSDMNYSNLREQEEQSISGMRLVTLIERFVFIFYFSFMVVPFVAFLTEFEMINF